MNKVQLIGRVGNPFRRNGTSAVGEFTFATVGKGKDEYGNWTETTDWHIIKVLGETNCQRAEKFFMKGKPLYLEGSLKTETWTNQTTGNKESRVKVYLGNWDFLPNDPYAKDSQQHTSNEAQDNAPPQDNENPF